MIRRSILILAAAAVTCLPGTSDAQRVRIVNRAGDQSASQLQRRDVLKKAAILVTAGERLARAGRKKEAEALFRQAERLLDSQGKAKRSKQVAIAKKKTTRSAPKALRRIALRRKTAPDRKSGEKRVERREVRVIVVDGKSGKSKSTVLRGEATKRKLAELKKGRGRELGKLRKRSDKAAWPQDKKKAAAAKKKAMAEKRKKAAISKRAVTAKKKEVAKKKAVAKKMSSRRSRARSRDRSRRSSRSRSSRRSRAQKKKGSRRKKRSKSKKITDRKPGATRRVIVLRGDQKKGAKRVFFGDPRRAPVRASKERAKAVERIARVLETAAARRGSAGRRAAGRATKLRKEYEVRRRDVSRQSDSRRRDMDRRAAVLKKAAAARAAASKQRAAAGLKRAVERSKRGADRARRDADRRKAAPRAKARPRRVARPRAAGKPRLPARPSRSNNRGIESRLERLERDVRGLQEAMRRLERILRSKQSASRKKITL